MTVDKRYCECEDPTGFAEFFYYEDDPIRAPYKECKQCGQEYPI